MLVPPSKKVEREETEHGLVSPTVLVYSREEKRDVLRRRKHKKQNKINNSSAAEEKKRADSFEIEL